MPCDRPLKAQGSTEALPSEPCDTFAVMAYRDVWVNRLRRKNCHELLSFLNRSRRRYNFKELASISNYSFARLHDSKATLATTTGVLRQAPQLFLQLLRSICQAPSVTRIAMMLQDCVQSTVSTSPSTLFLSTSCTPGPYEHNCARFSRIHGQLPASISTSLSRSKKEATKLCS